MIPLTFLLSHWRTIATSVVIAALGLALLLARADARHQAKLYAQEQAAHAQTVANTRLATAQAKAADLAHAREVEARDAATAKENERAYATQLADARTALARYISLHQPTAAHSSGGGTADMPHVTGSPGVPDRPGGEALVPVADLDVCTVNTTRLEQVREWWADVSAQGAAR